MKQSTSILLALALFVGSAPAPTAAAQARSTKLGVTLTNAYDAFGKETRGLTHDFGFSTVIEYRGKTILFDSGTDARVFEKNIKALRLDLRQIDIAIVSHGHYDHIGGFDYLLSVNPNVIIYSPNDFFSLGAPITFPFRETEPEAAATLPREMRYFGGEKIIEGMRTVPTGRFWKSKVEFLSEAREVSPGVTIVPTTSTLMGTFIKYPPFEEHPQFIGLPELSLSLATDKGDIVISGCSHSTIEAIVRETKRVRKEKVYMVVGGFHLIPYKREYIEDLALRMKNEYGVDSVAPAHCTGQLGFSIFRKVFGDRYRFFGLGETIELQAQLADS